MTDDPCRRAPEFLGVHTITLNQTTHIDGGGLRLWAGAAHHDDPTTDAAAELLRELEQRYASQALGDGLAERAERVSSVGASGSRRIGGPFLRAALGASDDFKHVWLSARLAESHAVGARLAEAHTSSEIHFIGAYRLRVLRVELVEADAAADELSAREGIRVSVAVDQWPPAAAGRRDAHAPGFRRDGGGVAVDAGSAGAQPGGRGGRELGAGAASAQELPAANFRRGGRGVVDAARAFAEPARRAAAGRGGRRGWRLRLAEDEVDGVTRRRPARRRRRGARERAAAARVRADDAPARPLRGASAPVRRALCAGGRRSRCERLPAPPAPRPARDHRERRG